MVNRKTFLTEEHHRRPKSIGGSSNQANISYVPREKHRAWHVLYGNMNAYQITKSLNNHPQKPEGFRVTCKFINGSPVVLKGMHNSNNFKKKENAWKELFGNLEFKEILHTMNNIYLDPSYHLYLKKMID
jgi:hypothetical protein